MCVFRYVFVILHYYLSQIKLPLCLKKKAYNSHFKGLTYFAEVTVFMTRFGDYFLLSGKNGKISEKNR